jgi:hypothetical protein
MNDPSSLDYPVSFETSNHILLWNLNYLCAFWKLRLKQVSECGYVS